jgi:hypothetical protein
MRRRKEAPVDLPDLEDAGAGEIQRTNVKASQALFSSAMLEKMRLFTVTDRLVELFDAGLRPLGRRKKRRGRR